MMTAESAKLLSKKHPVLGINGLGRIGKLTLWHHIGRKYFSGIVVNVGRNAGTRLEDIALYIEKDSNYGTLHNYLQGFKAKRLIRDVDDAKGTMTIDGVRVTVLRETRNPKEIPWKEHGVKLVVDATGKYTDPTLMPDAKNGAVRGHLEAGADKVIVSSPFKIKSKGLPMPDDVKTLILGINDSEFDPSKHAVISATSCTTTCLAFMLKPLIDYFGTDRILSLSMTTVHSSTGSQEILDRLPKAGAVDLRKNRSIMNNIILTTTGAAKTLELVIPEMNKIGFIAESVRIPVATGSLIILVAALHDEIGRPIIDRKLINGIYQAAEKNERRGFIKYTEEQNVSSDIIGMFGPAVIIEGSETHTRTATVDLDISRFMTACGTQMLPDAITSVKVPITQAVIYGWYDNEMGSYTNLLGGLTAKLAAGIYR
jgi:glyceraldehyde 3-phosphate dehydrogenase